jgi:two-component system, OmpR family, sensor histidine kinase SenX3
MRFPERQRVLRFGLVGALSFVLIALAVLQYRWSGEVSQAAHTRMEASLETSIRGFKHDFYQELGGVCFPFPTTFMSDPDWTQYASHYDQWKQSASSFDLVANVFVWERASGALQLLRLNPTSKQFEPAEWPPELVSFRDRVAAIAKFPDSVSTDAVTELSGNRISDSGASSLAWEIDQNIPALLHPLLEFSKSRAEGGSGARITGWIMIVINSEALRNRLLPELVQRFFSGPDGAIYRVTVMGGKNADVAIYSSDPAFGKRGPSFTDAVENLMSPSLPQPSSAENQGSVPRTRGAGDNNAPIVFPSWGHYRPGGPPILQVLHYSETQPEWKLLVRNRQGSLESMVAGLRYRTLAISFSVLLLLAISMALLFINSQRAHSLAKLQMDFVACVSHELRTPVAVICSTADNLADGVVDSKRQAMRYGGVIRGQARQLTDLVERIVLFAAGRGDAPHYSLQPVQVPDVLDRALANVAGMIEAGEIVVERHIEQNLPLVMGDQGALVQCVQNLITNAVKFGGEQRWIGISVDVGENGRREKSVEISVEDRGPGIDPVELDHIFEPFYRGSAALGRQIHGTGLGLALARNIAQAMRGRITVKSTLGTGSTFTLHLLATNVAPPVQRILKRSLDTDAALR